MTLRSIRAPTGKPTTTLLELYRDAVCVRAANSVKLTLNGWQSSPSPTCFQRQASRLKKKSVAYETAVYTL